MLVALEVEEYVINYEIGINTYFIIKQVYEIILNETRIVTGIPTTNCSHANLDFFVFEA